MVVCFYIHTGRRSRRAVGSTFCPPHTLHQGPGGAQTEPKSRSVGSPVPSKKSLICCQGAISF